MSIPQKRRDQKAPFLRIVESPIEVFNPDEGVSSTLNPEVSRLKRNVSNAVCVLTLAASLVSVGVLGAFAGQRLQDKKDQESKMFQGHDSSSLDD